MSLARPLFWRKSDGHPQDGEEGCWVADGISGRYHAEKQRDGTWLLWWAHDNFIWEACSTFAEVKKKAETDWQKRFREKLASDIGGEATPPWPAASPTPSDSVRREAIEECARVAENAEPHKLATTTCELFASASQRKIITAAIRKPTEEAKS